MASPVPFRVTMLNRVAEKLVDHWLNKYDWPAWEAKINEFKRYKLDVGVPVRTAKDDPRGNGTVSVHFIHERSPRADAIPIILTHGWPGSFFLDLIRPLTHPPSAADPAFNVVFPSLIGYGFSSAATVRYFGVSENGKMAQGGDWGSSVLAILLPNNCRAIHLNLLSFVKPPEEATLPQLIPAEESQITQTQKFYHDGTGYQQIQMTKPQTLGFAVSDSPHEWTDLRGGDGDFPPSMSINHFLTNVVIYYITNSITSSFRLYHYRMHRKLDHELLTATKITVPFGGAAFAKEIIISPERWVEYWCPNLVHWSIFERGGHFAALERPEDLIGDIRKFAAIKSVQTALTRTP
ncbi:alpha/beta-hydrolase [Gonapodya prolifera JEL478]|uniref:Alpha/beta-hydrolase n=1 Tax=Gonapodya prolifera (strain JEL478) TaxID=1344416 RepID=A0A139A6T1_GONPJ|nr:alpha/beta-hydrolase [Gonapodya prolifera JEL478]|eukprot:KXS12540.1 alpha/beta-hydrolase [Gonapodya prolifera JEL478]